ncbi:dicarboxylate/amino acid:cation symporter [Paraferrimonas sp. SM1919]|uniref:dicarboxylate/amino acid:cation symporter n=1 Tax=Paraferrimonas sp. SM1919 TaxID=2662263 RepID=UPI0013D883D0|nr:dicarboxylate/amino acid:cation symporter [Paraferrimonas sp. SM1919]
MKIIQSLAAIAFWKQVVAAFIIGTGLGIIAPQFAVELKPLGDLFISAIKMLVAPLVFCAIVVATTSLNEGNNLARLGFKTILMFAFTATIASLIGLAIGSSIDLGASMTLQSTEVNEKIVPGFAQVLLDMVPINPFASLAEGKVLQIIVFALLIGVAINLTGEKAQPLKSVITSASEVMFTLTRMVLKLTPVGVLGLMAWVVGTYGLETLLPLAKFIGAIYLACIIHIAFVYGGLVAFVAKLNPFTFFKKIVPAQLVAFTTASSYGSLPASTKVANETLGVDKKYSSFVLPMGATMNMDGCGGIYPAISAIFIAKLYGIELEMVDYLLITFTATIASIGTAGVPGSAMVMLTVTLNAVGLPLEGIAFIAAIDRIIDMMRTATNVTGDLATAVVVGKSEGLVDTNVYDSAEEAEAIKS